MIKEINIPMMAPVDGGASDESTVAWEGIPAAGPADIQSGRNVYIELNDECTATKASAGKILQFIKEGYMPVYKSIAVDSSDGTYNMAWSAQAASLSVNPDHYKLFLFDDNGAAINLYAYSDALEKPFTSVKRDSSGSDESDEGGAIL